MTVDIIGLITSNQKEAAVINENVIKDPVFTEAACVLMLNAEGMNRKDRARMSVSEPKDLPVPPLSTRVIILNDSDVETLNQVSQQKQTELMMLSRFSSLNFQ